MRAIFCIAWILFFSSGSIVGQTPQKKLDTVFCDCNKARVIKINGNQKVGPTISPASSGEQMEISTSRLRTSYAFEKEHHSAWYKLSMQTSGNLSFDVFPTNPEDDYDFMLFRAGNNNFCDSLQKFRIKPVRANISRDKNELKGKTGLSLSARKEFVKEGVNDAYSLSIHVNKGENYYLVVDNVYEGGEGHTILFFFEQKINIIGVVKNDENQVIPAEVTVTDMAGATVAETKSNPKTGAYEIKTQLKRNYTYAVNFFNDSSFVYSRTFTLKDSIALKNIRTILPKLKKGKKYAVGAINFYGNSPEYLPSARPSIENLYKLLNRNKNLKILVEGHVNCATSRPVSRSAKINAYSDEDGLSLKRAEAIKKFLVKKGIDVGRLSTDGKGCTEMLFPVTEDEGEMEQNRRVEIKVVDF